MSTVAPPKDPLSPALVDSEKYIDQQITRTRRALKVVDLAAGLITLLVGLLAYLLAAAVLDHWVFPSGLSTEGRAALFGLLLAGVLWYGWRQFVPLVRSINPVYAAHTIEQSSPSLKNSLLNLLLFRTHREHMSTRVFHALEQQAAQRLSTATIDSAIDRSGLLRLGYALMLMVAVCAIYSVLSPKNFAVSAGRVLAPWSDLAAPTRVQILDIRPGETSVALGERLSVSAEIRGLKGEDAVRLHYSTADEQLVDETIGMKQPEGASRFEAHLPRPSETGAAVGVQQALSYWIEAGDARSRPFKVSVFSRPTIVVERVRYDSPSYTGEPTKETSATGDIKGLEGTLITIFALANQPIKSAYVDFNADGRIDLKMKAEGSRATASFTLALRDDRRTPEHASYLLRFTTTEGRTNADPAKYRIDATPDYAPEIRITTPEEPIATVKVSDIVPIGVEANDPDFALSQVRLVGRAANKKGGDAVLAELLNETQEGRFGAITPFVPADAQLKPGDVLEYWAEARDNRRPEANVAFSEHRRLRIVGGPPQPPRNGQQPPRGDQPQDNQQPQGDNGQGNPDGAQGEDQQGGQGGNNGQQADGQQGQEQNQQGPGGAAGGQGQKGENANGQQQPQGAGGQGQAGGGQQNGQKNDAQQQPPGAGASGGGNKQQQPQKGAPQGQGQPGGEQDQSAGDDKGQPGDPNNAGKPGSDGAQQGQPQGGQPSKVASDGEDDGEVFGRIADHMAREEQQNPQQGNQPQPGDDQQGADQQQQPQDKPGQGGQKQGAQQGAKADGQQQNGNAAQAQKQPGAQGQQPQAGQRARPGGEKPQGAGDSGQAPQDADQAGGQSPNQQSGANGQGAQPSGQKPPAEGAQPKGPQETPSATEQQGQSGGQNPSARQGANVPRETKTGDGNPQDRQEGQQPSPDSAMNRNDGDAGSGGSTGEEQGSPKWEDQSHQSARNKTDEDNDKRRDDGEPPMVSVDNRESNSSGGKGGENSGGGQEGAGQHADAKGKGEAGQHEAADEGAGRADEQGQGETGPNAGSDKLAPGKTGKSSGDAPGAGSEQRAGDEQAGGQQPGAPQQGEQPGGKAAAPKAGQPQESGEPQAGEQGKQPADAEQDGQQQGKKGGQQPGDKAGEPADGGRQDNQAPQDQTEGNPPADSNEQPGSKGSAGGGGGSQSQGGGTHRSEESNPDAPPPETEDQADEANLNYARQQTDMVLERLDEQLAKKKVDNELLKDLGWNEEDLRRFVDRWKGLRQRADGEGKQAEDAKRELDAALRSLGLRSREQKFRAAAKQDKISDLNQGYRGRAPLEYAEQVRAYVKGAAASSSTEKP